MHDVQTIADKHYLQGDTQILQRFNPKSSDKNNVLFKQLTQF
jgi:hypothetical protein